MVETVHSSHPGMETGIQADQGHQVPAHQVLPFIVIKPHIVLHLPIRLSSPFFTLINQPAIHPALTSHLRQIPSHQQDPTAHEKVRFTYGPYRLAGVLGLIFRPL